MSCGSSDCITSTKRGLAEIAIAFSFFHAQGCGTIGGSGGGGGREQRLIRILSQKQNNFTGIFQVLFTVRCFILVSSAFFLILFHTGFYY
jgi:hypothetical protein